MAADITFWMLHKYSLKPTDLLTNTIKKYCQESLSIDEVEVESFS